MLYTFKSQNGADLLMLEKPGQEILAVIGKDPQAAQGIITVEQLPAAIEALQAVATVDQKNDQKMKVEGNSDTENKVTLHQHALPFIDMLKAARLAKEPITWGV